VGVGEIFLVEKRVVVCTAGDENDFLRCCYGGHGWVSFGCEYVKTVSFLMIIIWEDSMAPFIQIFASLV
jgi:hypothetical protein